jgi:16S rRNA (cytosine967-C5)-methyltransferase
LIVLPEEVAAVVLADAVYYRTSLRSIASDFFAQNPELEYMKPFVRYVTLRVARNFMLLDKALEWLGYGPPSHSRKWMLARVLAYEAMFGKLKRSRLDRLAPKAGLKPDDVVKLRDVRPRDLVKGVGGLDRLSILYSFPRWMLEELAEAKVPELPRLLEALNQDPTRWIRVAPGVDRERLASSLKEQGVVIEWDRDLPDVGMVVEGASKATRTREYAEGVYVLQDKASALVSHVARPEGRVAVDVTGGGAVKATHMAWLGARYVVASDVKASRLREALRNRDRLNVGHLLDVAQADGRQPPLRGVDVILVDPPCTDIGRLQYEPEIKMWLTRGDLKFYRRLQVKLLEAAVEAARPGTVIVYSVCTLTRSETIWVLRRLLEGRHDVELTRPEPVLGEEPAQVRGSQRLYPHVHRTQGFFIAKMVKL